ncbi:MAG: LOG family protein [Alphaproteobacteria bacterium]|nr:LOG family protein [Alphaproteobacteria bacterium]
MNDTPISEEKILESFRRENRKDGVRVFVAGGSRSGTDSQYTKEAYNLGKKIVKMEFRLDFGLSNSGIMGAVAKGVLDGWNKKQHKQKGAPIQGITTEKYIALYPSDDELIRKMDIVVARTLEERKQMLLKADFVVFAPGGVGTLDELAYDCVAMQDGMLPQKPFIIYNINGFFHHLLEFLKFIAKEGFADPVPFIVVDDENELEIAFRLLKLRYVNCTDGNQACNNARQVVYDLPYFIKQKMNYNLSVEDCLNRMNMILDRGEEEDKQILREEIETAYLEREISRMYERLVTTGKDTGSVSEKLSLLKKRRKDKFK